MIGCIDGTSIQIRKPAKKIKSTYTNRHDIPAITLQGICDHNRKFIDVFTGVPGKVHDARVFNMSEISKKLPGICGNRFHILGDSAYAIRTWLLIPYKDYGNLSREEQLYNKKLSATRVKIENCFGILKGRFRQLLKLEMNSVVKMTKFIVACCILHNLCIDNNDLLEEAEVFVEDENEINQQVAETDLVLRRKGEEKRNIIKSSLTYL